ncbi:MAG: succinylglutamate desuccinylase/aspartoacylase family protein [Actinobacteria bacterium]|nr:succinylglutamate desuccinylase/aspartoacylase family protein [Actinomycetota bacterium]
MAAETSELYRWFPEGLADELLELDENELLRALGKPTLIRVPGRGEQRPRAIATLLHGDETTGYQAVLRIMRRRRSYPFDLYVLIGNVRAALADEGFAHRYLDDQEDFNRVWGLDQPTTQIRRAADALLHELREAKLESLVDVHNNSGNNPFYAIVTVLREDAINLATLFTSTILHWELDARTLMEALQDDCPAIAVECGLPDRPESLAFAVDGLRRYLGSPPLRDDVLERDFDLLGAMRKVLVRPEVLFRFGGDLSDEIDFVVAENSDVTNFRAVEAGHVIGRVHAGAAVPLLALDAAGNDVTEAHFHVVDGAVVTTSAATPVMMTRTVEAARKDCLFYLTTPLRTPVIAPDQVP